MSRSSPFLKWIGVFVLVTGLWASESSAQTPKIYLDLNDTTASPGSAVQVSVFIQNLQDSIAGFQMMMSLSRPDIMEFISYTQVQTCYRCADSACTSVVAYPCTVSIVPMTTEGTLTHNWEYVQARTTGGFDIRLTGLADNTFDRLPLPILPFTSGILIKVIGHVLCDIPDTLQDRTVSVNGNLLGTYFSDTKGQLITPVSFASGSVTVLPSVRGDLNYDGAVDVLDVVQTIDIAFSGGASPCPVTLPDVNCDDAVDVLDVVYMIDYAFSGGPPPC